eukprot:GFUD01016687.1.p1 GENE.GFUD01016687.1~~GFUD01016687.1.p1  ORF type:complete len:1358 (+),score=448.86 GFUD01016687.1:946-5019(+)
MPVISKREKYFPDVTKEKELGESPSSHRLLSQAENGKTGMADINSNRTGMEAKKVIRSPLSFFSHKIGVGGTLGLQEYMVTVNSGQEDELEVWGYRVHVVKYLATLAGILLSFGLLGLPLYWWKHWWLRFTRVQCILEEATSVLVVDHYKGIHTTYHVKDVYRFNHAQGDMVIPANGKADYQIVSNFRYFNCKKNRYIWDNVEATFYKLEGLDRNISLGELHAYKEGLSEGSTKMRSFLYGKNEIVVPMESLWMLFVKEILSPFYVFQLFSICFWYADDYWQYSTAILLTSCVSLASALYQTRKNQQNLRDTIVSSEVVTRLRPDGTSHQVISSDVVPGDIIVVPDHGCQLLCDAVLLEGVAIMDESMLTGESVPVTKSSLDKHPATTIYNNRDHEKHTLKCGTKVIQTRKYRDQVVTAVVIRTGYLTSKGDLVRSILYPPPVDFQFEKDSHKFIAGMACIATVGMIYSMVRMVLAEESFHDVVFEVFDLITIVVPPALPAAMTIGIVLANQRLLPKNIFCISPRTINVAGAVDCTCFDKTGTITEDGMDMWGVLPVQNGLHSLQEEGEEMVGWREPVQDISLLSQDSLLVLGMATCHELNIIGGEMRGDPLDEKMFSSTGWMLEMEGEEQSQLDQLSMPYMKSPVTSTNSVIQAAPQKLFQFSSDMQRMSVVTRVVEEQQEGFTEPSTMVFCKGSPEMIQRLCLPDTLPPDYTSVLESYASHGYRILAMAGKVIVPAMAKAGKLNKMTREQVEADLTFLGLVILENRLKTASIGVLTELRGANIRTVMVTGDNILTAVSVARDCGLVPQGEDIIRCRAEMVMGRPSVTWMRLVDRPVEQNSQQPYKKDTTKLSLENNPYHLAVDGASFEIICDSFRDCILPFLATRGAVFARMRPDMKQRLVEILQDLDYRVIMCGDGANDCGALKAANAGISLSEAEASVASPFTSKTPDISCVPILIRESRAALVTSFGIFKYMAAYSITQFVSVMILYDIFSNLSDFQFLWIDLFLITTLAAVFGFNNAYSGPLAPHPPMSSLISLQPLFSLLSQLAIGICFQVAIFFYTRAQPWFVQFDYDNPCYIGTPAEAAFNSSGLRDRFGCDPEDDPVASYENFSIFTISQFQYIILVIAFSKGYPYRESFLKNLPLLVDILLLTAFCLFLTVWPESWNACQIHYELFAPPQEDTTYRLVILAMVGGNLVLSLFCEMFVSDVVVSKMARSGDKKHEKINLELSKRPEWPPLSTDTERTEVEATQSNDQEDSQVFIMGTDIARPTNQAFDSLFSTPVATDSSSHSAAAVSLNPPTATPKRHVAGSELMLSSPCKSFSTAQASPTSSNSTTGKFVSCDRIDTSSEPEAER